MYGNSVQETVFLICCLFGFILTNNLNNIDIDEYVKLINERIESAKTYELPKNAYRFEAKTTSLKDYGEYDFIVVGGGSSGAVVASRLSENSNFKVLLLEAGDFPSKVENVSRMGTYNTQSQFNWGYTTIPQKTACLGMVDQICPVPRGLGLGGTSLLNALIYSRGSPIDFDLWKQQGNPGWSYEEVLPFFKKSEDFRKNVNNAVVDTDSHGYGGPLSVEYHIPTDIYIQTFFEANNELGFNSTDVNSRHNLGYSPTPFITKNGIRWHTENAFIRPVLNRNNLKVLSGSFVTKILFSKNCAEGVEFTYKGNKFHAKAKKEVILSAGAIGTPQILMLSGIGPKSHLQSFKIKLVKDLPVGTQLLDHGTYHGFKCSSNYSTTNLPLERQVQQFADGTGPLTSNGNIFGLGFYQTKMETIKDYTDLELLMISPIISDPVFTPKNYRWTKEIYNSIYQNGNPLSTFTIIIIALHSKSRGFVKLKSNNPFDYPLINLNLISDEEDRDINTLYEGIQLAQSLLNTTAFKKIDAKLSIKPIEACKQHKFLSKDYWMCNLRQLTYDIFHPSGTCPMGSKTDTKAVVDSKMRVYGIEKLRIADASIFPFSLSGHPSAVCMMIGEKLAAMLKEEYS